MLIFSLLSAVIFTFKLLDENNDKLIIRNLIINDKIEIQNMYQAIKFLTEDRTINFIEENINELESDKLGEDISEDTGDTNNADETSENETGEIGNKNSIFLEKVLLKLTKDKYRLKVDNLDIIDITGQDSYLINYWGHNIVNIDEVSDGSADSINMVYYVYLYEIDSPTKKTLKKSFFIDINIPANPFDGEGALRGNIDYSGLVCLKTRFKYGDVADGD